MLGAIVGDIIGSPFEFSPIKHTDFRLFETNAQCTDDSVLTVATAHALLNDRDYATAYQNYFARHPNAGYGGMFVKWANRRETQPYNSWGNGSAMRVSPVAWAFDTLDAVLDAARNSAEVTHNHPEGILGAQAAAACVFLARTEKRRERIREFVSDGCGYDLDKSIDEIRPGYSFKVSCRGTVPVAVQAFLESTSFEHAIRLAVSVGGDADTLACITGAIAEAYYGGVPSELAIPALEAYIAPDLVATIHAFYDKYSISF